MTNTDTDTSTHTDADTIPDPGTGEADALTALVDLHLAAYCDPDPARRADRVAAAWQPDGVLVDPPFDAAGHDGIVAITDAVLGHFPDHVFRRTTAVDAHHAFARYGWQLVGPDGAVAVAGTDLAEVRDGRLVRVVGFFGDLA